LRMVGLAERPKGRESSSRATWGARSPSMPRSSRRRRRYEPPPAELGSVSFGSEIQREDSWGSLVSFGRPWPVGFSVHAVEGSLVQTRNFWRNSVTEATAMSYREQNFKRMSYREENVVQYQIKNQILRECQIRNFLCNETPLVSFMDLT
jgi:hypothetical protein